MSKAYPGVSKPSALSFPNPSRSYDETGLGVRFWGYDKTMEVAFFVDAGALSKLDPSTSQDETGLLDTFDVNCEQIRTVASNIYSRRDRTTRYFAFNLTDLDF